MITKKIFLVSSFVVCAVMSVKPLSETTKNIIAVTGGVAVGAVVGIETMVYLEDQGFRNNFKPIASTVVSVGSGALTWYILDSWLYTYTPEGHILNAMRTIAKVEKDFFVTSQNQNERAIIEGVYAKFDTKWPLVLARSHILDLVEKLDYANKQLDLAFEAVAGLKQYYELCEKCNNLAVIIPALKERLAYVVNVITKDASYQDQAALYEKHVKS